MNCAKCYTELQKFTLDGVEVDKCPGCSGIWFDFGELDDILQKDDITKLKNQIDNNQGHDDIEVKCPKCQAEGKMVRVVNQNDSNLHIDTCTLCYGQWLDGGELEKLKEIDSSIINKIKNFIKL